MDYWSTLRDALLNPRVDDEALKAALHKARAQQPLPVLWLLGKAQAGKTSIIHALTGSDAAEIGNGFQPCTRTARFYDFPVETPILRFLDTRGLGEVTYDPAEDIQYCEAQAHLILAVMKATDGDQSSIFTVLQAARRRHPEWPVLMIQTGLHEAYPPDIQHVIPYPYDCHLLSPFIPVDLRRVLTRQRDALGALPGTAPVSWVAVDLTLPEDGLEPVHYGLDALWQAIGEVSSLGLQAMLRGDAGVRDVYDRAIHPHLVGYSIAAAGLGALPLVDLVGVPALQAKLLHSLSVLYGQVWDKRTVSEFLGLLGIGAGVHYLGRMLGREVVKLIPYWGQTVGAVWGATASGATTFAIGKAAAYYFFTQQRGEPVEAEVLRQVYAEALVSSAAFLNSAAGHRSL
ncbi:MAG: hypothetical protein CSA09_03865 [Candidatus Contendobacter odensis]|uniref:G domain-containing protein n=1 Tax=Candidatus Contendibacter odensensis TaxID=1400860 RepID=A0A2G6PFM2_9GAMM|nr:MAG: hypothetical protein CSA09_03865 [Candidatus Contendobacter odensis]